MKLISAMGATINAIIPANNHQLLLIGSPNSRSFFFRVQE
jgi:hypothetical protein